jgi:hypothetical protein
LRLRKQQLFSVAFVLGMALVQQSVLQRRQFVFKAQLQTRYSLFQIPLIQTLLPLQAMRAMLFSSESSRNVVEIRIALGSSRNIDLWWTGAPRVLVFVRLGYGLYNDISLVLGLANDIRTGRGFPVLVLRWAYWLLQEGGTAFMLRLLLGRRLLGASRGKLVEPSVVHVACVELARKMSFKCYNVSRDVACSWSSWSCAAYEMDRDCVELSMAFSEMLLSDRRGVSKGLMSR